MIATNRRMAILDFLLITSAVIAISLSALPEDKPRQTLLVRDSSGDVQEYSLRADDPRLATLQRHIDNWPRRIKSPKLATHKWLAETADHYAAQTEPPQRNPEPFVAASFKTEDSTSEYGGETSRMSEQHEYWISVAADARAAVTKTEIEIQRRQHQAGPPPIALGHIDRGGHSPRVLLLAGVFGICVATGFARWTYICPSIRLAADPKPTSEQVESDVDRQAADELRLAIPPHWVRLRQRPSVVIRQSVYGALLVLGIGCALI